MNETRAIFQEDIRLAREAMKDPEATERLLEQVYPRIFQIVRFTAKDRSHADDLAQLAAMEVLSGLGGYKGKGSIASWAGRIAYRTAVRTVRKERRMDKMHLPLFEEVIPHPSKPELSALRADLFDELSIKLEKIPSMRRIPLLLHLAYGYTVEETAALMDTSPNTIKDRLKTAYQELRNILKRNPQLREAMVEVIS